MAESGDAKYGKVLLRYRTDIICSVFTAVVNFFFGMMLLEEKNEPLYGAFAVILSAILLVSMYGLWKLNRRWMIASLVTLALIFISYVYYMISNTNYDYIWLAIWTLVSLILIAGWKFEGDKNAQ